MRSPEIDILLLSNGPGEVTTWVRPVVKALRQRFWGDRQQVRISLILSPCPNASGREVAIAQSYPEIDRVQGAAHFFSFLLWGKTAEHWDWCDRGVVVFLGGDQLYPVLIGRRLSYPTVVYGEWEIRWHQWVDRFGVMQPGVLKQVKPHHVHKCKVVGDLMAEVGDRASSFTSNEEWIGLLPGSKPAKLAQGVPLTLAIAHQIHQQRPQTRFVLPVAPTLDLPTLARFADPHQNPVAHYFGEVSAELVEGGDRPILKTNQGLQIQLETRFPAYEVLANCRLCLTTIGANTAELGALAIPMLVLMPLQQLDAMRSWDGLPGILANLPGVGTFFTYLINRWYLRNPRLLAWPNIWAGEEIVPELLGELDPKTVAAQCLDLLSHPEKLDAMRDRLRQVRGQPGAAQKLVDLVQEVL